MRFWLGLTSLFAITCLSQAGGQKCSEGDGFYAVGCSNKFIRCVKGESHDLPCPSHLFFDTQMSRCELKSKVAMCRNPKRWEGKVVKARIYDCSDRSDGVYGVNLACSSIYLFCNNKVATPRRCPNNQFYDKRDKACNYAELIPACRHLRDISGYVEAYDLNPFTSADQTETQKPTVSTCSSVYNATVVKERCSTEYWTCNHGELVKNTCPSGLYYDGTKDQCDYRDVIAACSPLPAADQNATVPAGFFDCTSKRDGFYEVSKCHPSFVSCNGGTRRDVTCQKGLVYDHRIHACDYPMACKSDRKQEDAPLIHNHGRVADTRAPVLKTTFNCRGKEDGNYYEKPCETTFLKCSNGDALVQVCPSGLTYNPANKACDYPLACRSIQTNVEGQTTGGHGHTTNTWAPVTATTFSCSGKADGVYYEKPCESTFVKCVSGEAVVQLCPSGLTYNPANRACDYPLACRAGSTTGESNDSKGHVTSTRPPVKTATFDCRGKADGVYYEKPCESTFLKCADGEAFVQYCPSGLTYNPGNYSCDYPEDCGRPPSPTPSPVSDSATPSSSTDDEFSCTQLANGAYAAAPCNPKFYTCWNENRGVSKCYGDLVFNPYNGHCDFATNVPECRPSTNADSAVMAAVDPFCERLADGLYGFGCNNFYYQCRNFETTKLRCAEGHFFNLRTHTCTSPSSNSECEKSYSTTPQPPSTDFTTTHPRNFGYYATTQAQMPSISEPLPPQRDQKADFDCSRKTDGIYGLPYCTSKYVQCVAGKEIWAECRGDLYYSETTGLCDYRDSVPACSSAGSPPAPQSDSSDNFCAERADAFYSLGCSSAYVSCVGGTTHKLACPAGLKFSAALSKCGYDGEVAECGAIVQQNPNSVTSECGGKADGVYHYTKCSSSYLICQNGQMTLGTCVAPLLFNPVNGLCDYRHNNADCNY